MRIWSSRKTDNFPAWQYPGAGQKEGGFFSPGRDGRIPAGSESLLKRTVEKKECCLEFSDL